MATKDVTAATSTSFDWDAFLKPMQDMSTEKYMKLKRYNVPDMEFEQDTDGCLVFRVIEDLHKQAIECAQAKRLKEKEIAKHYDLGGRKPVPLDEDSGTDRYPTKRSRLGTSWDGSLAGDNCDPGTLEEGQGLMAEICSSADGKEDDVTSMTEVGDDPTTSQVLRETDSVSRPNTPHGHGAMPQSVPDQFTQLPLGGKKRVEDKEKEQEGNEEREHSGSEKEEILKFAVKEYDSLKRAKAHSKTSASQWKLVILEEYIKEEDLELILNSGGTDQYVDATETQKRSLKQELMVKSRYVLTKEIQFDEDRLGLRLWALKRSSPTEASIKFLMQSFVEQLCAASDMSLKMEHSITLKPEYSDYKFPAARMDYMFSHGNLGLACIEAKTPQGFTKYWLSVPQLVVQLLNLQMNVGSKDLTYVGVLMDGYRFIVVKLRGRKLYFEKQNAAGIPKAEVHYCKTWEDYFRIFSMVAACFQEAVTEAKNNAVLITGLNP